MIADRIVGGKNWWRAAGHGLRTDLVKRVQAVVAATPIGAELVADFPFVFELLRHHPQWLEKQGCGVGSIQVVMHPARVGATRGLQIVRVDGSKIDISWHVAIAESIGEPDAALRAAGRTAIIDQVAAVRRAAIGRPCPICGKLLVGDVHVDHHPVGFEELFSQWLVGRGEDIVDTSGTEAFFTDPEVAADWSNYHAMFAELRLIHAHENLAK